MPGSNPIDLGLLFVLCVTGIAVTFYALSQEAGRDGGVPGILWLSLQIGAGGGLFFWLVLRWLGFGQGVFGPAALGQAVVRAAIWSVVAWPLTAWRLEQTPGVPHHRSHDVTTFTCGVMLLLFFIVTSAAVVLSYR